MSFDTSKGVNSNKQQNIYIQTTKRRYILIKDFNYFNGQANNNELL